MVQQFLGLANYYRSFIENYSTISKNLGSVINIKSKLQRNVDLEKSFNDLKTDICGQAMLHHSVENKEIILTTDASNFGLGGWIGQEFNGKIRPICFASRSLSKSEQNYSATKKELLGLVWSIKKFHDFLWARKF